MFTADSNLHFIRHAQTTFNQANQSFKMTNSQFFKKNFDQLSLDPNFRNNVRFHYSHIDCSITQKGKMECRMAREQIKINGITPDLVLVSPFNRTLQTCNQIFGNQTPFEIVVQPLVGQIFKSSCDVSHPLETKIEKFSHFNFEECLKLGRRWDILKNSQHHSQNFTHILENNNQLTHEEEAKLIIELMSKNDIVETQQHLFQRCSRFINKLRDVYTPKYRNIAVVTHFMFLDCVSASSFRPDFMPVNGIKAKNCGIHTVKFSELIEKRIIPKN